MTKEAALRAFVAARVDEDEAAALAAKPGDWNPDFHLSHGWRVLNGPDFRTSTLVAWSPGSFSDDPTRQGRDTAAHIARHDPARVLREVAAKRDHLAMWDEALARRERAVKLAGSDSELHRRAAVTQRAEANGYCEAVMRLVLADAAVYSDHPAYNQSWAIAEDG